MQLRMQRLNEDLKGCEAQIHSGMGPEERCSLIETLLVRPECATPSCFTPQNDLLKPLMTPEAWQALCLHCVYSRMPVHSGATKWDVENLMYAAEELRYAEGP